jgi:hypothetical protein
MRFARRSGTSSETRTGAAMEKTTPSTRSAQKVSPQLVIVSKKTAGSSVRHGPTSLIAEP